MSNSVAENAEAILAALAAQPRPEGADAWVSGRTLSDITGLSPDSINDAATILVESGLAEWLQTLGSGPYNFSDVWITPRGRYEYENIQSASQQKGNSEITAIRSPIPVGSPFGFTDYDWELVAERKAQNDILYVVLGFQFKSTCYKTDELTVNILAMFDKSVMEYNKLTGSSPISLDFQSLAAGYGEHLFNDIARDIISADIAVFETSDQNPNVMIELGVALTWGVRVLPIKVQGCEHPPSDISGQTWADYVENGSEFIDPDHDRKLLRMVERAARKKVRPRS